MHDRTYHRGLMTFVEWDSLVVQSETGILVLRLLVGQMNRTVVVLEVMVADFRVVCRNRHTSSVLKSVVRIDHNGLYGLQFELSASYFLVFRTHRNLKRSSAFLEILECCWSRIGLMLQVARNSCPGEEVGMHCSGTEAAGTEAAACPLFFLIIIYITHQAALTHSFKLFTNS